jgi:hypothetical protein
MSLSIPSVTDQEFDTWMGTTIPGVKDPNRKSTLVMLKMSVAQAGWLGAQTSKVTALSEHMAKVNDLMNILNDTLATNKLATEDTVCVVSWLPSEGGTPDGAKIKLDKLMADLIAEGVPNQFGSGAYVRDVTPADAQQGWYQLVLAKSQVSAGIENLRLTIDKLSSTNQQAQLNLQTLMGRYNGVFELVSGAIKRSETQFDTVTSNFRR